MKKRHNRDLIIFIILVPIFLFVAFGISKRMENKLPRYSVDNKAKAGLSVYYEVLQDLGYSVDKTYEAIGSLPSNEVQVVAQGKNLDINSEEIMNWIGKGGTLVYIEDNGTPLIEYGLEPEYYGGIPIYKYKDGKLIVADGNKLSNIAIRNQKYYAYNLLSVIHRNMKAKVYFNEAHLYLNQGKLALWDAIPFVYRFLFYQFFLGVAAYIYFKSKRFGKPVPYFEEEERSENEYLYSAAALYKAAGAWELILNNYYESFLRRIKGDKENWIGIWEEKELPSLDKAREIIELINSGRKLKKKEYIKAINTIDYLRKLYDKRSESQWKMLKKI